MKVFEALRSAIGGSTRGESCGNWKRVAPLMAVFAIATTQSACSSGEFSCPVSQPEASIIIGAPAAEPFIDVPGVCRVYSASQDGAQFFVSEVGSEEEYDSLVGSADLNATALQRSEFGEEAVESIPPAQATGHGMVIKLADDEFVGLTLLRGLNQSTGEGRAQLERLAYAVSD